jgi:signal transduction histidine kinase
MGDLYLWHSDINNQTIMFYRSLRGHGTIEQHFDTFISHLTESEQDVARYYLNNTEKEQLDMNVVFHFRKSPFDENEAWYNMRSTPKFDYFGNIIGHRGVLYDVTKSTLLQHELSEVTKRAEASNQLKSGFMASMTHELRTPLNAIMGFTDILRVIDSPEERTEYIRIVRNNCDMLVRLINDIFEASTITEGPDSIEPTDVDFAKSFDDICLMLEQRVTEPGLEFLKDNPYKSFRTTLDMGRIQQIITNFVTNAVKFTKQGHIKVGYRYERYGLYIYCEDTGSGIPKENQSMIFERFVKLDEYVQGTGLGLNICKSIAERCGGKIGVLSEGEGKGSTFWVWIPCKQEQ